MIFPSPDVFVKELFHAGRVEISFFHKRAFQKRPCRIPLPAAPEKGGKGNAESSLFSVHEPLGQKIGKGLPQDPFSVTALLLEGVGETEGEIQDPVVQEGGPQIQRSASGRPLRLHEAVVGEIVGQIELVGALPGIHGRAVIQKAGRIEIFQSGGHFRVPEKGARHGEFVLFFHVGDHGKIPFLPAFRHSFQKAPSPCGKFPFAARAGKKGSPGGHKGLLAEGGKDFVRRGQIPHGQIPLVPAEELVRAVPAEGKGAPFLPGKGAEERGGKKRSVRIGFPVGSGKSFQKRERAFLGHEADKMGQIAFGKLFHVGKIDCRLLPFVVGGLVKAHGKDLEIPPRHQRGYSPHDGGIHAAGKEDGLSPLPRSAGEIYLRGGENKFAQFFAGVRKGERVLLGKIRFPPSLHHAEGPVRKGNLGAGSGRDLPHVPENGVGRNVLQREEVPQSLLVHLFREVVMPPQHGGRCGKDGPGRRIEVIDIFPAQPVPHEIEDLFCAVIEGKGKASFQFFPRLYAQFPVEKKKDLRILQALCIRVFFPEKRDKFLPVEENAVQKHEGRIRTRFGGKLKTVFRKGLSQNAMGKGKDLGGKLLFPVPGGKHGGKIFLCPSGVLLPRFRVDDPRNALHDSVPFPPFPGI